MFGENYNLGINTFQGRAPREMVQVYEGESLQNLDVSGITGHNENVRRARAVQRQRADIACEVWADFVDGRLPKDLMREAFNPGEGYRWSEFCRRYPGLMTESMDSSDFSALSDQVLTRSVLANYQLFPTTYQLIAEVDRNIPDFRPISDYAFDGGKATYDVVKEKEGFKRRTMTSARYDMTVLKYEAGYEVSWEAIVNDNINMFQQMPRNLVIGGNNSIEKFSTGLYTDVNGPIATFFTSGNSNIITGNPALNFETLQAALAQWMNFTDADSVPINVSMGFTLVVGNGALFLKAKNIKETLLADITNNGGTTNERLRINNWVAPLFNVVYNPWIPQVATTANAATSWWLFANAAARPAMKIGFLRGFDTIQMFKKAPNTMSMGGGIVEALGDFETMSNEFKGLTVFGGRMIDAKAAIASNGSGS